MNYQEVSALMMAPGTDFELTTEVVGGRSMQVFAKRDHTLRDQIANAAAYGDRDFLVYGDQRIGFAEFAERVWGASHALLSYGIKRHDRVGILAYNRPEWVIAMFGAASVGAICVGLNGWWTADELEYGLTDSGCRYLIVDDLQYPRVAPVLAKVKSVETVFYIGDNPPPGTVPIAKLLERHTDMPTAPLAEDDPFVILYTSGTTGRPKGCITTHRGTIAQLQGTLFNFIAIGTLKHANLSEAEQAAAAAKPPPDAGALLTSPLFHVAALHGTICVSLRVGAKVVFGPPKFDAEQVLQLLEREKITTWMAIPTLLQRLIEHPNVGKYDLSTLAGISTGGAPTAPELAARAQALLTTKPALSTTYGLTEVHGMATSITGDEYLAHKTSVGRPIPCMQIRIIDDDGRDLPLGKAGQILLSGPTLTPGYWNRPDATAEILKDGWLYTGDIGYVDSEGFLYISDRAKDMIIRGGENVYCTEIENVLAEHPEIVEAAIIGVPDRDLGERVKAFVLRTAGSTLDEAAVKAHVATRLAKFKVPEVVEFTSEPLARNAAGKLLKNGLRKQSGA